MAEIRFPSGAIAHLDDTDYVEASKYTWTVLKCRSTTYARAYISGQRVFLHRFIMELHGHNIEGLRIDHEDRNGLNNHYSNLRLATRSQNRANSKRQTNNTANYIGIDWHKPTKKWRVRLMHQGVRHYIGEYDSAIHAALAYDQAAIALCGEFASLNFPDLSWTLYLQNNKGEG